MLEWVSEPHQDVYSKQRPVQRPGREADEISISRPAEERRKLLPPLIAASQVLMNDGRLKAIVGNGRVREDY